LLRGATCMREPSVPPRSVWLAPFGCSEQSLAEDADRTDHQAIDALPGPSGEVPHYPIQLIGGNARAHHRGWWRRHHWQGRGRALFGST
jgi:hypothetical protein